MSEGVHPLIVVITPASPIAGSVVSVQVTFDAVAEESELVTISSAPAGFFSSIPAQVTLASGNNQLQFSATVASSATGGCSVSATCNGATAMAEAEVQEIDT